MSDAQDFSPLIIAANISRRRRLMIRLRMVYSSWIVLAAAGSRKRATGKSWTNCRVSVVLQTPHLPELRPGVAESATSRPHLTLL